MQLFAPSALGVVCQYRREWETLLTHNAARGDSGAILGKSAYMRRRASHIMYSSSEYHYPSKLTFPALIRARNNFVCDKITSLPKPANAIFAVRVPTKNFPSSVPSAPQTYFTLQCS